MKKRIALIIAFVLAMSTLSVVASATYDPNYHISRADMLQRIMLH